MKVLDHVMHMLLRHVMHMLLRQRTVLYIYDIGKIIYTDIILGLYVCIYRLGIVGWRGSEDKEKEVGNFSKDYEKATQ